MSEIQELNAEKRVIHGTGNSRDSRNKNKIPCIIYGEKKDPLAITLEAKEIKMLIQKPGFFSKQFNINVDGVKHRVLAKDLQLHPVKESVLHVDFLRIGANTKVTVAVPVKFTNENLCPGLKQGGVINIVRRDVELKAPISKIPSSLNVNLDGLEIGDSIHISSIEIDPDVIPVISDRDFTIATIAPPTVQVEEDTKTVEDATGEESPKEEEDKKEDKKEENSDKST